jgi:ABC-type antimicrobial peptide transport system permease subunit
LRLLAAQAPTVYLPQLAPGWAAVQLRTELEPAAISAMLQQELPHVHPTLRILDVTLQSTLVDNALVRERALALLSGFFSIVAMVLVTVGLYGILSYSVVARTREIGIRLALGARPLRVIGLVLTEVAVVTTIGLAVGVAGGFAGSRFITALLYQVQPSDVRSVALPLMSVLVAAASSAVIPALRATHVDPMTTLRND